MVDLKAAAASADAIVEKIQAAEPEIAMILKFTPLAAGAAVADPIARMILQASDIALKSISAGDTSGAIDATANGVIALLKTLIPGFANAPALAPTQPKPTAS
jgi:hypothetical protein